MNDDTLVKDMKLNVRKVTELAKRVEIEQREYRKLYDLVVAATKSTNPMIRDTALNIMFQHNGDNEEIVQ